VQVLKEVPKGDHIVVSSVVERAKLSIALLDAGFHACCLSSALRGLLVVVERVHIHHFY